MKCSFPLMLLLFGVLFAAGCMASGVVNLEMDDAQKWEQTESRCGSWIAPSKTLQAIGGNRQIVVDGDHALPVNFVPPDLVPILDFIPGEAGYLQLEATTHLADMFIAAEQEAGINNLSVLTAYRAFTAQCEAHSYWVELEMEYGASLEVAEMRASRRVIRQGHDEHQLGLAVDLTATELGSGVYDLDFIEDRREGRWLSENSWRFGFVRTYPSGSEGCTGYAAESHHFRYIGVAAATAWHDLREIYSPYEFLRGRGCDGSPVPGRGTGGIGFQLPSIEGDGGGR